MKHWLFFTIAVFLSGSCGAVERVAARPETNTDRPTAQARHWIDASGRFQIEAVLVNFDASAVTLRRFDEIEVRVPRDRLSNRDRQYLERLVPRRAAIASRIGRAVAQTLVSLPHAAANQITALGRTARTHIALVADALPIPVTASEQMPLPRDIVYVDISQRMLRKKLSRPILRQTTVDDVIVGTPVRGGAQTTGMLDVRLVPAANRGVVDLFFQGRIDSQTVGFGGPVQVHSSGVTRFSAVKRLSVDGQGIAVYPARASAQTSTAIQGVSTNLPRIRGWIARRIGSRRANSLRPAAEAEAARKAEAQIARELDRDVEGSLFEGQRFVNRIVQALPRDLEVLSGRVEFATTASQLRLVLRRDADGAVAARPPSFDAPDSADVVVHVHRSLVDRVARNTALQSRLQPLLALVLAGETERMVSDRPDELRTEFHRSADGQWWSLVIRESE